MSTIDGNEIKSVTIDGAEVSSITMDGLTVWQKLVEAGILRSIEVGDNLSGKTLYFGFPNDIGDSFPTDIDGFVPIFNNAAVGGYSVSPNALMESFSMFVGDGYIGTIDLHTSISSMVRVYDREVTTSTNMSYYTLPVMDSTVSIVTAVNTSHPAYQYIKIIDDGLRNVEVGDDLSNKQLYLSFPNNLYLNLNSYGSSDYIFNTGYNYIYNSTFGGIQKMQINEDSDNPLYHWNGTSVVTNLSNVILQSDFGIVSDITPNHPAYPYVKIRKAPYYKNIEVGDNLSGATLYMEFPDDFYKQNLEDFEVIISGQVNGDYDFIIRSYRNDSDDFNYVVVGGDYVYDYYSGNTQLNESQITLDSSYGLVEGANNTHPAYKYIFVKMRNIEVGDDLSNKTLYFNFPDDLGNRFPDDADYIIRDAIWRGIWYYGLGDWDREIFIDYDSDHPLETRLYSYNPNTSTIIENKSTYILGSGEYQYNIGVVSHIDKTHPAYQFIWIIDN